MTTRSLMEDIECDGIHHIDGTYRITTNGFPLIVYGISDQCHNKCSCPCNSFIKLGVCLHLVAISFLFDLNLFKGNYVNPAEVFVQKTKKGRKRTKYGRALDKELLDDPLEEEVEIEVEQELEKELVPEVISTVTSTEIFPLLSKKSRGRPPKSTVEVKNLVDSTADPTVVRRSTRIKK